jgi:hypothetical protein
MSSVCIYQNLFFLIADMPSRFRPCLDPLRFIKNWFMAIVYINWFIKKLAVVFGDQFIKTVIQFFLYVTTYLMA